MKYKVIALIGEAGCGKDTLAKKIQSHYPQAFNLVVTATTRPPREGEIEGKDYYFMTEDEFKNTPMIETACFNNWWYGTPVSSFKNGFKNIVVINPAGVKQYLDREDIDLTVYWLQTSPEERIRRQFERETAPDIKEIKRRAKADKKDFNNLSFENIKIIKLKNENTQDLRNNITRFGLQKDNLG